MVNDESKMNLPTERTIFLDAIELSDALERREYLENACGDDRRLRDAVERLLQAHDLDEHPLDKSPIEEQSGKTLDYVDAPGEHSGSPPQDPLNRMIGPYRLMEQIGEGGFGVVYVAQQEKPVRRKVALKMVKPGMGSKEVIARFEAERQALALMDHPCIARVFDAGVSDDSRPYFVMELVRGIPITEFCDKARMNIPQRLELFMDVCSAVHHAHQKGVIHRDLKPSNVLTTLYDDKPVAKIIDFGIAKAIGQSLTDKTIYTRFMSLMGTPLYMSPEQAEMNTLDVDTRSDIYSLGVLLYELLTGTTPIDRSRMDAAGYNEIRRIILEEEPPIPSNRISTLGNRISTISGMRQIEPSRLTSSIRGDLDWIVMKAMDKDRKRRYDSAAAMARDIHCYLHSEPIEARPPSRAYRLSKFAQRNRALLVSASLIAFSLLAGTAFSVYQMSKAVSALQEKQDALREALIAKKEANEARDEIAKFSERIVQSNVFVSSGQTHASAGRWQAAIDDFAQAIDLQPSFYLPWVQRGQLYSQLHLWQEATNDFAKALTLGAPTGQPQWMGAGALFALFSQTESFEALVVQERKRLDLASDDFDWQSLRNCVISIPVGNNLEWSKIAAKAESQIEQRGGTRGPGGPPGGPEGEEPRGDRGERGMPRRPGEPNRFGPGHREYDNREHEKPEGRRGGPEDRQRPPFGGGLAPQRPRGNNFDEKGFDGGPAGEGPRLGAGPRREGFLPMGAQCYVTAIAYIRAGDGRKALNLLERADLDRGWIGRELIHSARAIALHQSGQTSLAKHSLSLADRAITRWTGKVVPAEETTFSPLPWFDLVEGIVLHSEATQAITGTEANSAEVIEKFREHALVVISEEM
jgi:serine/threonine protein kinase